MGKQTLSGRTAYYYKVGYDKAHFEAYIAALKDALDKSKLNDWSKAANDKDLSKVVDIDGLDKEVKKADANYRFDLWVDAKTRLIAKLQFTKPNDSASIFSISQQYSGGDQYPFTFTFDTKDTDGNPTSGTVAINVNSKTDVMDFDLSAQAESADSGGVELTAKFKVTPNNKPVNITAPSGATPVMEVIQDLFGGLLGAPASSDATSSSLLSNL